MSIKIIKKRDVTMSILISWLFLAYFLILGFERTRSVVLSVKGGLFNSAFDGYVNVLAILSLAATVIMMAAFNGGFFKSLFIKDVKVNYTALSITAGVILVSGMVHTEHTVAPLQFVSYGFIIAAMALQTALNVKADGKAFFRIYSLIYLVLFSMAIPVMYKSEIKLSALFHVIEAVTSLALVAAFAYSCYSIFTGNGVDLLYVIPFIVALAGDGVILALRWNEKVNVFVLMFIVAATVIFIIGKILFKALSARK